MTPASEDSPFAVKPEAAEVRALVGRLRVASSWARDNCYEAGEGCEVCPECKTGILHTKAADLITRLASVSGEAKPIDMLLFCPMCGIQHVDEPDERTEGWTNPAHRSHLCHGCGCIWRPADVPMNGVVRIATVGKADTWGESNSAALATPSPDYAGMVEAGNAFLDAFDAANDEGGTILHLRAADAAAAFRTALASLGAETPPP